MPTAANPTITPAAATADASARQDEGHLLQLVGFTVGSQEFAVPILSVREINRMMPVTRDARRASFIDGVIHLRGQVIAVVDLRRRFGIEPTDAPGDGRLIVVETGSRAIGLAVDQVSEVLRLGADMVEPSPAAAGAAGGDCAWGVGRLPDRRVILLDPDRLLSHAQMRQLDDVTRQAA